MEINNPQIFNHIKEIDGDVLRPETLSNAEIDSVSKASEPTAWKQDSDNKYCGAPWLHDGNGNQILAKVVEIGDWNMDSTSSINIDCGINTKRIIAVIPKIRPDSTGALHSRYYGDVTVVGIGVTVINAWGISETTLTLNREDGPPFDNAQFDETDYNRGWLLIIYTANDHEA
jgi:hypothetical protein